MDTDVIGLIFNQALTQLTIMYDNSFLHYNPFSFEVAQMPHCVKIAPVNCNSALTLYSLNHKNGARSICLIPAKVFNPMTRCSLLKQVIYA